MTSVLYRAALASLTAAERSSLVEVERWLKTYRKEEGGREIRGGGVLANLRAESHLLGEGLFGEHAELAVFLKSAAANHAEAETEDERHLAYQESCSSYQGKGMRIERTHLPDGLLRYSKSHDMVRKLIEALLGRGARLNFDRGTYRPEEAFADLAVRWDAARAAGRLGWGSMVFATFEHVGGAPRNDARALAQALALPLRASDRILVELSYPTDSVGNYRFPTVADVGWTHEFQPAQELAPDSLRPESCYGRTRPAGEETSQPELVHCNEFLHILDSPPRLVGRLNP